MNTREFVAAIQRILEKNSSALDAFGHPEVSLDSSHFEDCAIEIAQIVDRMGSESEPLDPSARRIPVLITDISFNQAEGYNYSTMKISLLATSTEQTCRDLSRMYGLVGKDLDTMLVAVPKVDQFSPIPSGLSRSTSSYDSSLEPPGRRFGRRPLGRQTEEMIEKSSFFVDHDDSDYRYDERP